MDKVNEILNIINKHNYEAYICGGACRDILMNIEPHDIDITTNAKPDEIKEVFKGYKTVLVGEKFGTVIVIVDGKQYEITTFRSEGDYNDKRHPNKVIWETDITKDLSRRDFTINSLAIDSKGNTIDPFEGRKDIEDNIIRCVGNPDERFGEDRLRMLRAVRFAGKLNFRIDDETFQSIKRNHSSISEISAERIRDELLKMMETSNPYFALEYLNQTGLLNDILPEVARLKDIEQNPQHHRFTVMYHLFETIRFIPKERPLLRMTCLLHDVGKLEKNPEPPYFPNHVDKGIKIVDEILNRLKFSNENKEYIKFLIQHHMDIFNYINSHTSLTNKSIRRFLKSCENNIIYLNDLFDLIKADIKGSGYNKPLFLDEVQKFSDMVNNVLSEKQPFSRHDLAITGNDLLKINVPATEVMGKILKILLDKVIENPELNNKEDLLKIAQDILDK